MALFSRRIAYDRKRILDEADRLRGGWRWRRALELYRQILAAEPHDAEIHFRAAPLLARSGRPFEAWQSFRTAAARLKDDRAGRLALHRKAVAALPKSFEACRALARAELRDRQPDRACQTLLEGSRRLRRRRSRGEAIVLLRDAREIDAWRPEIVLSLCRLLARDGQPAEALFLLDQLDERVADADRLRARALVWRIEPSLRHSWRWLRARREAKPAVPGRNARHTA